MSNGHDQDLPGTPLLQAFKTDDIPLDLIASDDLIDTLNKIAVSRYEDAEGASPGLGRWEMDLTTIEAAVFDLPGLDGFALVLGGPGAALVTIGFEERPNGAWLFTLRGGIQLRFPKDWLHPVVDEGGEWIEDPEREFSTIDLSAGITIDQAWSIDFSGGSALRLRPSMISDSGFVIEAVVGLDFSTTSSLPETIAMGLGNDWRGVILKDLTLHLPKDLDVPIAPADLRLTNFHIGSGGISGSVAGDWTPTISGPHITGNGAGQLFGLEFGLRKIELTFLNSSLSGMDIRGAIAVPFFDQALEVDLAFDLHGKWQVTLSAGTAMTLRQDDLLELQLRSIGFGMSGDVFLVRLSGSLRPLVGGIEWPSFDVQELDIDSQGHVRIQGGWIDLRDQASFSFYGFTFEVSRIGFGQDDDGTRWVGFDAAANLVESISLGGSVQGMKIHWRNGADGLPVLSSFAVSVEGIGVEFEIPDTLRFEGDVHFSKETIHYGGADYEVNIFRGDLVLDVYAADLEIDASIVIGILPPHGNIALYIFVGVELPVGIPLGNTGVALYGFAGLFAMNMAPNKHADEEWYQGWYKRDLPPSATKSNRWGPEPNALGLGAGVTIGTMPDNGFTVSGKMLFVLVFPGPIVMIEGKANILKARAELDHEPVFRALVVLDGRAGTLLVGVDAHYSYDDTGALIGINASAEGYFNFNDASDWHVYVGRKDPTSKRVRATILSLFEANAYFMMNPEKLLFGAWVGYDRTWSFGPLRLVLSVYLETDVELTFSPIQLHGSVHLHGELALKVWGFGVGLMVDAALTADVPRPYKVTGHVRGAIDLPWPLPDFSAEAELTWTQPKPEQGLLMALKDLALGHEIVADTWGLPRGGTSPLLLPNWEDPGQEGFVDEALISAPPPAPDAAAESAALARAPVVPLDVRPQITFARPVKNSAGIGAPDPGSTGQELVGTKVHNYELRSVVLERREGGAWAKVAARPAQSGVDELHGTWAPVFGAAGAETQATKLLVFSRSAFDYTRSISSSYDEWVGRVHPTYPCPVPPSTETVCADLEGMAPGLTLPNPWEHPDHAGLRVEQVSGPGGFRVTDLRPDMVSGRTHAIELGGLAADHLVITFPRPASNVELLLLVVDEGDGPQIDWTARKSPEDRKPAHGKLVLQRSVELPASKDSHTPVILRLPVRDVRQVELGGHDSWFLGLCWDELPSAADMAAYQAKVQHLNDEAESWSATGNVLAPHSSYRLSVTTRVGDGTRSVDVVEHGYFKTEGPPALAALSAPSRAAETTGPGTEHLASPLDDLTPYVDHTMPASGQRPVYRAYDLGVEFNKDYVELMYGLEGRDLGLYLFDQNGQPVRDPDGRLVVPRNVWSAAEQVQPPTSTARWIATVNGSACVRVDPSSLPPPSRLGSAAGQVLSSGSLYEARLVPLLLREPFDGTSLSSGWQVVDPSPAHSGPSSWELRTDADTGEGYVIQTSNVYGGDPFDPGASKPGTHIVRGDPAWTDYRMSVVMRAQGGDGALGVVFRWTGSSDFYRFAWDQERRYRRLTRHAGGTGTVLVEDPVPYMSDTDYEVVVEAVGQSIAVYVKGDLVASATDSAHPAGKVGLYCWAHQGARFSDVRVDDLRARGSAPIAYSYRFTTSLFANFRHQLHSYDDHVWRQAVTGDAAVRAALGHVGTAGTVTDAEDAAFATLTAAVFGAGARRLPDRAEVTLVADGSPRAWLVECPEPVDWSRTTLSLAADAAVVPPAAPPQELKLIGCGLPPAGGAAAPNDEWVDVLERSAAQLDGVRLEYWREPGTIGADWPDLVYFSDDFNRERRTLLFEQSAFGPNALDAWRRIDEVGPVSSRSPAQSSWTIGSGDLVQTSNFGRFVSVDDPGKPGALLVTGDSDWRDYRLSCELMSDDDDGIGVVFRYAAADTYYRLSLDGHGYRRLIRRKGATVDVLWEDREAYVRGRWYPMRVDCAHGRLIGFVDGHELFDVDDPDGPRSGGVGLWSWFNRGSHFRAIRVDALVQPYAVLDLPGQDPALADFEPGPVSRGGRRWTIEGGRLVYAGWRGRRPPTGEELAASRILVPGSGRWGDHRLEAVLTAAGEGEFYLLFDHARPGEYQRLVVDFARGELRLERISGGQVSRLWAQHAEIRPEHEQTVALELEGDVVRVMLEGERVGELISRRGGEGLAGLQGAGPRVTVRSLVAKPLDDGASALFSSRFADTLLDRLNLTRGGVGARWALTAEGLAQLAPVVPDPGAVAMLPAPALRDFELKLALGRGRASTAGVVFHCVDLANTYRLLLGGTRALMRVVDGTEAVLWSSRTALPAGDHELRLTCDGSRIRGYLDGAALFDVEDSALPEGAIGLYAAGPNARFGAARVLDFGRALDAWRICDRGTLNAPSEWLMSGGEMLQLAQVADSGADRFGTHAVAGDETWTDVRFSLGLASTGDGPFGVVFRYVDERNHYRLALDHGADERRLVRYSAGTATELWSEGLGYAPGTHYDLVVEAVGDRLRATLDGTTLFDLRDGALPRGKIGLYDCDTAQARFDAVLVERPPIGSLTLFRDRFAADDASGWTFGDAAGASPASDWAAMDGTLPQSAATADADPPRLGTYALAGDTAWGDVLIDVVLTATNADGSMGVLFRHVDDDNHYRFAMNASGRRELVKRAGGTATTLWQDDAHGFTSNRRYRVTVSAKAERLDVYLDGVPIASVVDYDLPHGRIGLYTWGLSRARFSQAVVLPPACNMGEILYEQVFAGSFGEAWDVREAERAEDAPSEWAFVDGEIRQSSGIGGLPFSDSNVAAPGTLALAGDAAWSDYRLTVRIASGASGEVGILFRAAGEGDYYRFSMNRKLRYRRLVKAVGGSFTVLFEDGVSYEQDRDYMIAIDAVGDRLRVYVDGASVCDVRDSAHATGRIGLHAWCDDALRVSLLRVEGGSWELFHQFRREPREPDGTLLQVHSGSDDRRATDPGTVRRYSTPAGGQGSFRLQPDGARLRLVNAAGTTLNERSFRPDSEYSAVAASLLRRRDGAAFYVLVPDGAGSSLLPSGGARLRLTYRRDDTAVHPFAPIYSQDGLRADETVLLDL